MMGELRLGDIIDDYCVKCRRLTNHAIVSIIEGAAAKVRCRTCYHDHDYRNEQAPPSKKDLKKAELFAQVLANAGGEGAASAEGAEGTPEAAKADVLPEDAIAEDHLAGEVPSEEDLSDEVASDEDLSEEDLSEEGLSDEVEDGDESAAPATKKKAGRKTVKK